jgi:dipeptidyl aminopeptidase/acylaminoacyl peptidase
VSNKSGAHQSYPINLMVANQQTNVIHSLPDNPDHILISYPEKKGIYPAVFKVNIHSGISEKIVKAQKPITSWLVDRDGKPLMGHGMSDGESKLLIRNQDDDELVDISDRPLFKTGYFTPLEQGLSDNTMYVSSSIGKGRAKIYHYNYEKNLILSKIYEHPRVDVEDIIYSRSKNKILAVYYVDDVFQYSFFDKKFEDFFNKLSQNFIDNNIRILNYNENGEYSVVASGNDHSPTDYYIYNKNNDEFKLLVSNSKALENFTLSPVEPITYFSRDGLEIHSYLTKPINIYGEMPGIIMPHGGPWARDALSYNDWAQFFANRGYVVLQPNFRGSTGYGNIFTNLSIGEWGGKMQEDLTDGVKWLVKEKIVDPNRICIVGASYGGYAALMGAIKDPELYRCAISYAPVTDINSYINTYKNFPDNDLLRMRVMGNSPKSYLKERSPSKQTIKIKIPILLAHGNNDIRVDIKHSKSMVKSLQKTKKNYKYIELENESHFLLQNDNKIKLFHEMEIFLKNNLM